MFGIFDEYETKEEGYCDIEAFQKALGKRGKDINCDKLCELDEREWFTADYYLDVENWEREAQRVNKLIENIKLKFEKAIKEMLENEIIDNNQAEMFRIFSIAKPERWKDLFKIKYTQALYSFEYLLNKKIITDDKKKIEGKILNLYNYEKISEFEKIYPNLELKIDVGLISNPNDLISNKNLRKLVEKQQKIMGESLIKINSSEKSDDALVKERDREEYSKSVFGDFNILRENPISENNKHKLYGYRLKAKEKLPRRLRQLYEYRYEQKLEYREIAKKMHISTKSLSNYNWRLKKKLKNLKNSP